MSKNTLKLFYRNICKDLKLKNLFLYQDFIQDEILRINNTNLDMEKNTKEIIYYENLMVSYINMKNHIKAENDLLQSYNINVKRDTRKDIESVARRVGLKISF